MGLSLKLVILKNYYGLPLPWLIIPWITMILHLKNIFNTLCRKASQKLHALFRISQYLSQHKKQILFKTFIMSQFNYRPLVWMSHSRGLNNKINNIHKRAIRIVYQDRIYRIHYRRTNPCLSTWKTYNIYLQKSIT